jgi:hypothetical protein
MSKTASNSIAAGIVLVCVGMILLSKPNCERGCQTVGEHLLAHGVEALLGVFAV